MGVVMIFVYGKRFRFAPSFNKNISNNPLCQGGVIYRLTQVSGCVFISDILGNGDSNSCDGMCDDKRGITSLG